MRIITLRLQNFQSYGPEPTEIHLDDLTYVLGPNGAGKTATLEALSRLFSPVATQRRVQPEDFHIPVQLGDTESLDSQELWLEVDIEFPEASDDEFHPTVPPNFSHMALATPDGVPGVRIRLTATLEADGYVDEKIEYITQVDDAGNPLKRSDMSRQDRAAIEVHYLPARRDPAEHISYATASLLGRMLRAADWTKERTDLEDLSEKITTSMSANAAVAGIGTQIQDSWSELHRGAFFKEPAIAFGRGDIDGVLRLLTLTFEPVPGGTTLNFERLSDGQKSLLYISIVLAWQRISRLVLSGESTAFDPDKLRPPVHTVIALEEPENSLSPQYLGRIVKKLKAACGDNDIQGIVATHASTLLRRVPPESIRFLRLNADRTTTVQTVVLPDSADEAAKYVREAVEAFPELYFSRLVILGEGDSEQIVLPRVLAASDIAEDDASISVVPLGGRHVHHFWRLLECLGIPYVTLLDLDAARYQGGWGRISYAAKQVNKFRPGTFTDDSIAKIEAWNSAKAFPKFVDGKGALHTLEKHGVYFSYPVDLDLMLLEAYPNAYGVNPAQPDAATIKTVLGKSHINEKNLGSERLALFDDYQRMFKRGSKPANHLSALAALDDDALMAGLPGPLARLTAGVQQKLESIPE